jgi:hypothetical protein
LEIIQEGKQKQVERIFEWIKGFIRTIRLIHSPQPCNLWQYISARLFRNLE